MGTRLDARRTGLCRQSRVRRALTLLLVLALGAPALAAYAQAPATTAGEQARATPGAARTSAPARPDFAPLHEPLERYPQSELGIRSGDRVHRFRVWISDTPARREQGLMWVKKLPPDRGMLFVFEQPQLASFWMKNTYIPLDLLFVARDGRVIRIAENATPHSLDGIGSMGYVTGVLELAGGTSKRLSLRAGDVILHPAFARR